MINIEYRIPRGLEWAMHGYKGVVIHMHSERHIVWKRSDPHGEGPWTMDLDMLPALDILSVSDWKKIKKMYDKAEEATGLEQAQEFLEHFTADADLVRENTEQERLLQKDRVTMKDLEIEKLKRSGEDGAGAKISDMKVELIDMKDDLEEIDKVIKGLPRRIKKYTSLLQVIRR